MLRAIVTNEIPSSNLPSYKICCYDIYAYFSIPIPRNKFFHHTVPTANSTVLPNDVLLIPEALIGHPLCTEYFLVHCGKIKKTSLNTNIIFTLNGSYT